MRRDLSTESVLPRPAYFVPGCAPSVAMPRGPSSLTFLASATSTGDTLTIRGTSAAGDVAVIIAQSRSGSTPTTNAPAGWSAGPNLTGGPVASTSARTRFFAKILDAADISAGTVSVSGNGNRPKGIIVLRANRPVTALAFSAGLIEITGGTPANQTVPVTGVGAVLAAATASSISFSSTPTQSGSVNPGDATMLYYGLTTKGSGNYTVGMADGGTLNILTSCFLLVT